MISVDLQEKYNKLKDILSEYSSVVIAFSGGVDSTFLLKAAHDVLGKNCKAVTAVTPSFPERERNEAISFCQKEGIDYKEVELKQLDIPGFIENPKDRCYICKKSIFLRFKEYMSEEGFSYVAEGTNTDDMGDYRPGMKAIEELEIKSPLREAGLSKADIRILSEELGLTTWNKPSLACLATRIPYGEYITQEKLSMIDRAEEFLVKKGFDQVRVRLHEVGEKALARIEIPADNLDQLISIREEVDNVLKEIGFLYVTVDMRGYRTGAMDEIFK